MNDVLGRVGVIVSARTDSTRLPGKALLKLGGVPMILFLLERIAEANGIAVVSLATTDRGVDDDLAATVEAAGFSVHRGMRDDLVRRYVEAASLNALDHVVRITGDCPFVNAESLEHCIKQAQTASEFDLATTKGHFPKGIDYEVYPTALMAALDRADLLNSEEREHLTLHLYRKDKSYRIVDLVPQKKWKSDRSYTVDTQEDLIRANLIVDTLGTNGFSIEELVALQK